MIYKFRIQFEDIEDTYFDIEIKSVQTFEDLHNAIQKAIKFDGTQMASFFMSNDNWRKGTEIALMDLTDDSSHKKAEMHSSVLADFIDDPHQKILYEMDNLAPDTFAWVIGIELIKIQKDDPKVSYPNIVKSVGKPPKQYKKKILPAPEEDDVDSKTIKEKAPIFEAEEHFLANENAEDEDDLAFGFGEEGEEEENEEGESEQEDGGEHEQLEDER